MSHLISLDEASKCMKCGFCLSSCPVYAADHLESHVARGRNVLIKGASEGNISLSSSYAERLSYCLLCGRCQVTCLAKVPSPAITVAARTSLVKDSGLTWRQRLVYRGMLSHRSVMARLLRLTALLPGFSVKNGKPLRHLPDLATVFTGGLSLPALSSPFLSARVASRTGPPERVSVRGRVAVFPGCAFEFFFAEAGEQMVKALAEAGYEVIYPEGLTCCGIAVRNAGDLATAQLMARKNIEILSSFDRIISGCATCSSTLKDYAAWFARDDPWNKRAADLSIKVRDLSQFLAGESFQPLPGEPLTVTYHDPCHLKWHQGISLEPRSLLCSIQGVKYVEMEGADECCGLGGAFGIDHREVSLDIQAKKMRSIKKTGAHVVATSCPGCMIQLMDGARRHGINVEVKDISQMIRGQKAQPRKRP